MKTKFTRRQLIKYLGLGTAGLVVGQTPFACSEKKHIITLSFDDGFEKSRGHEIMPHSYDHQNLTEMPLEEAKESILRCLDVFNNELNDFDAKESVYNFAYNASSPKIEEWLGTQVRAFRTGGPALNPPPYPGQKRLTCISHGPENIDQHLGETIDQFLEGPDGWFIYNTHGLDDEGWGPVSSAFLDELLDRLSKIKTLEILPAGKVLSRI